MKNCSLIETIFAIVPFYLSNAISIFLIPVLDEELLAGVFVIIFAVTTAVPVITKLNNLPSTLSSAGSECKSLHELDECQMKYGHL